MEHGLIPTETGENIYDEDDDDDDDDDDTDHDNDEAESRFN